MNHASSKGTAVVTGASSGIGAIYADRLANQGYDLILVARNRARLDELATRLTGSTGRAVQVLAADLSAPADLRSVEAAMAVAPNVAMLVNNAGVGATQPLLDSDTDKMNAMIALNVTSVMRLTKAIAPGMIARGSGTIVNIASIAALAPDVLNGVYSGTKAFVLAFSLSLHHELGAHGVRVQAVLPGATSTEFWGIAGMPVAHLPDEMVMPAGEMVDAALAGLAQHELVTIPSLPDMADWERFEAARNALRPNLSRHAAAGRYKAMHYA